MNAIDFEAMIGLGLGTGGRERGRVMSAGRCLAIVIHVGGKEGTVIAREGRERESQ